MTTSTPTLPPRTTTARPWLWSTNDQRIAAREDDAIMDTELSACIARCLSEGVS